MEYSQILYELEDSLCKITLNRPERLNSLNEQMVSELRQAFKAARRDENIKVVLITGNGRAFCVGRDIHEYQAYDATPVRDWEWRQSNRFAFNYLEDFEKPIIAAINGLCYAGGFELALTCDIRIASKSAKFALPEINVGIFPGGGATWLLPRVIGKGAALRMILSGCVLDTSEAHNIGFIDIVTSPEELDVYARNLATEIATKSLSALKLAKAAVNLSLDKDARSGMKISAALRALAESTYECKKGIGDFYKDVLKDSKL